MKRAITGLLLLVAAAGCRSAVTFPVEPEPFITQFRASEGLTFNGEGQLFMGANRSVWIAQPDGTVQKIADVHTHLGQAGVGRRDILAADFGPTNVFRDGPNDDGIVWRITPEGEKTAVATGIADPNFILVLRDGSWLVSDDGTDKIYRVRDGGNVEVWSSAVAYPNGLALSLDERTLYVAQIFSALGPVVYDNRVWAIPLTETFDPAGPPKLLARTGNGVDGLAVDEKGFLYVADNQGGKIWRVDPRSGASVIVAEGMSNVASLAFGEGAFDPYSIYATTTERGGGTIWRVRVGVKGARLHR
jgi:DNA-binding beta-propeller fold protein YncE